MPSSKSYTNRALLLAALADGESVVRNPLSSDDAEAMAGALRALGAGVEERGSAMRVTGTDGRLKAPAEPIHCRDSGTTIRFLTAAAALADGPVTLTGSEQLCRRTLAPLLEALSALGARVSCPEREGFPPVTVQGPISPGTVEVDASASSQFASALLMTLGALPGYSGCLTAHGLVSAPYVEMTLDSMSAFGVLWAAEGAVYRPDGSGGYRAGDYDVEYDASAAGHILATAALSGGSVTVENAVPTRQPDSAMEGLLRLMGAGQGNRLVSPGEVDMSDWPDMLTTVAVLAAFAEGRTTINGAAHARGHETDRIAATARELARMGVAARETADGLIIEGGEPHGAVIETYGDHRMAMAFAAAGAAVEGVVILDPGCVRKTYPGFWDDLRRLGVRWEEQTP